MIGSEGVKRRAPKLTVKLVFFFLSFFLFFPLSLTGLQPKPLNRFWLLMAQTRRFRPRKCPQIGVKSVGFHLHPHFPPRKKIPYCRNVKFKKMFIMGSWQQGVFTGVWTGPQPEPLDACWWLRAQTTCFGPSMCILGVSFKNLHIWGRGSPKPHKIGGKIGNPMHYKHQETKSTINFEPLNQSPCNFQGACKSMNRMH